MKRARQPNCTDGTAVAGQVARPQEIQFVTCYCSSSQANDMQIGLAAGHRLNHRASTYLRADSTRLRPVFLGS